MSGDPRCFKRLIAACLFTFLALQGFSATACAAGPPRINVLFLMADDLNNSLGCYGDPRVKTPNIDRLAARGVRFDRAYCQFPLCGPSRNVLLTGLYPNSTGILNNGQIFRQTIPAHHSLPQAFRHAGYFAGRIGKLYHFNVPGSIGTDGHDDPASWELQLNPAGCDRLEEQPRIFTLTPGQFGATLSWYASPKSDSEHTDGMNAADGEWVLERCARQKDRPFFLGLGFFRPHTPYISPRTYFERYAVQDMPVVRGVKEDRVDIPAAALASAKKEQDQLTDDLRQQAVQAYYASISFMDAQVGRILDAVDRLGLAESTIIVFTSDHGYHLGEHGLWQKMSLFEESARVPLIVVAPGAAKGAVVKSPVGLVDLYPTLVELCGVQGPGNLQGQSLVPMLRDASSAGRGWALTQVTRAGNRTDGERFFGYSLRTPRWRYTEWAEGEKGRELYDHDADPRELTNLAADPAQAATVEQLSTQLRAAVKSTFPESGKTPEIQPGVWAPMLAVP
ncbi:MAG TPA: sulfatase [Planctomycetaceae bacterium]|nr:sulfatase [Planctomycetaceae bacterium]